MKSFESAVFSFICCMLAMMITGTYNLLGFVAGWAFLYWLFKKEENEKAN